MLRLLAELRALLITRAALLPPDHALHPLLYEDSLKRVSLCSGESLGYKYEIDASSGRRLDREVLRQSQPEPTKDGLESIIVDGKYLGPTCGFVTLVVNARIGEPLQMAPDRDKTALDGFF